MSFLCGYRRCRRCHSHLIKCATFCEPRRTFPISAIFSAQPLLYPYPFQLLALELWDVAIFIYTAITRQLNLEALTVNAPPPPLLYPTPGWSIVDQHRRRQIEEIKAEMAHFPTAFKASARFSLSILNNMSYLPKSALSTMVVKTTQVWLTKTRRLVSGAAHGLVLDYIFHQPTIVLVWIFIALVFFHFFSWIRGSINEDSQDSDLAAAAIIGWLFLVGGGRGGGGAIALAPGNRSMGTRRTRIWPPPRSLVGSSW